MPAVAWVTIWWTAGFSILLFLAGLRAIPVEIYEAAALDNASRWTTFRRITWPLLWPVTALVFTIQLILQLKIFDQVYLFVRDGRPNDSLVLVYYIFQRAFQMNQGGRAAAAAVVLFTIVIVVSVCNSSFCAWPEGAGSERASRTAMELLAGAIITVVTTICAVIWAFPIYWGAIYIAEARGRDGPAVCRALAGAFDLPALRFRAHPHTDRQPGTSIRS